MAGYPANKKQVISRLKRIEGHVRGLEKDGRG
jgi:DNA-binding FrmR family transcriptional regulator